MQQRVSEKATNRLPFIAIWLTGTTYIENIGFSIAMPIIGSLMQICFVRKAQSGICWNPYQTYMYSSKSSSIQNIHSVVRERYMCLNAHQKITALNQVSMNNCCTHRVHINNY